MPNPFDQTRQRVARARKLVSDFKDVCDDFFSRDIGDPIVEDDSSGQFELHKFKLKEPVPGDLADIAFDSLGNLRSALDLAGFSAAVLAGNAAPKSCKFPCAPDQAAYRNNLKGGCKDLLPEVREVFESFPAYKGGNDVLWALNELANANKHKFLVPVAIVAENMSVTWFEADAEPKFFEPAWDSVRNEITFAKIAKGQKFDYSLQFVTFFAFDHPDIPKTAPAPDLLNMMADNVEQVIEATEVACRGIGLL